MTAVVDISYGCEVTCVHCAGPVRHASLVCGVSSQSLNVSQSLWRIAQGVTAEAQDVTAG